MLLAAGNGQSGDEDLGRLAYDDWEANRYHASRVTGFSVESFKKEDKIGMGTNPLQKPRLRRCTAVALRKRQYGSRCHDELVRGSEELVPSAVSNSTDFTCEFLIINYLYLC